MGSSRRPSRGVAEHWLGLLSFVPEFKSQLPYGEEVQDQGHKDEVMDKESEEAKVEEDENNAPKNEEYEGQPARLNIPFSDTYIQV